MRPACSKGKGKYLAAGLVQKGDEDRCEQEQPQWMRTWKSRTISCSLPQAPPSCLAQDDLSLGVETITTTSGPLFLSSSSPGRCVLLSALLPRTAASSRFCGREPSLFRHNKQQICAPKKSVSTSL